MVRPKTESIRADLPPEMAERLDKAVGMYKLRGDKELGDRSKLVRHAIEKLLAELDDEIDKAAEAAAPPKSGS